MKNLSNKKLGRFMMRSAKHVNLPEEPTRYLIKGTKIVLNPSSYFIRKYQAKQHVAKYVIDNSIRTKGHYLLSPDVLPNIHHIISQCKTIYKERASDKPVNTSQKPFLRNLLSKDDLQCYPELLALAASDVILDTAIQYLKTIPKFTGMYLWWSPANETSIGSQLFHLDREDFRQAKFFINILDVSEEHGPLTFLPADISQAIKRNMKYTSGHLPDSEIFRYCKPTDAIQLVGKGGVGAMLDTSRCFHHGSRTRKGDRLVLMLSFLGCHEILESSIQQIPFDKSRFANCPLRSRVFV